MLLSLVQLLYQLVTGSVLIDLFQFSVLCVREGYTAFVFRLSSLIGCVKRAVVLLPHGIFPKAQE